MAHAIDYKGKLAIATVWNTDPNKPQRERTVWVTDVDARDVLPRLAYDHVTINHNTAFLTKNSGSHMYANLDECERIIDVEPLKKPRAGKRDGQRYDWEWKWGDWRRVWLEGEDAHDEDE